MATNGQVKDLGWANSWGSLDDEDVPEIVKKCRELGHRTSDVDIGPPMRGMNHVVTCQVCGYLYHYDSSD